MVQNLDLTPICIKKEFGTKIAPINSDNFLSDDQFCF